MSTRLSFCSRLAAVVPAIALAATFAFGSISAVAQEAEDAMPAMESMESMAPGLDEGGFTSGEEGGMAGEDAGGFAADEGAAGGPMDAVEDGEIMEGIESPYGLTSLLREGDFVARGTFFVLAVMSIGSWYIMILRLIDTQILYRQANTAQKNFWGAGSLKEGIIKLEENSVFRAIVDDGLKAADHHEGKLTDAIDLNEWVTMSLQRSTDVVTYRLQSGLAVLASVGSTAPFVGLFGTVWGILNALIAIGVSGQVSIDKVAGPLGEALIMTAIGLFVAVPAVLGYNFFVRRNKVLLERVRNFAADIHAVLISGGQGRQAAE